MFKFFEILYRFMFIQFFAGEGGGDDDNPPDGDPPGDPPGGDNPPDGDAWKSTLPEDVQKWDEVKNSKDGGGFWDQMTNMKSRMGNSIRIPGEDASDEDRTAFHKKLSDKVPGLMKAPNKESDEDMAAHYASLGAPEKADEYKLDIGEKNKDKKLDLSLVDAFRPVAQANGLTQKQFHNIVNAIVDVNVEKAATAQGMLKANRDSLKEEWGGAYKQNSEMVTNFAEKTNAPDMIKKAIKDGLMDQGSMEWIHKMAVAVGPEGSGITMDETTVQGVLSPSEALERISEIRNNGKHPYHVTADVGHKAARDKMGKLYKMAYPDKTEQTKRSSVI